MTRHEMQALVQDQINKGLERTEAIRNLAFHLDEDDPGFCRNMVSAKN